MHVWTSLSRRIALSLLLACQAALLVACRNSSGEPRVVPRVDPIAPRRVAYSPTDDGRFLVLEAPGVVGIWDVSHPIRLFASLRARAIDAAFSEDGRHVATVSVDGRVRWWAVDGNLRWTSETGHEGPARAVAVAGEMIVSGGEDGTLRFWRQDGTPARPPLQAHDGAVVSVDVSPRGEIVSLGGDEALRLWRHPIRDDGSDQPDDLPTDLYGPEKRRYESSFQHLLRFEEMWGWDHSVAFSPSGDLVAAALYDGSIRLWQADGTPAFVIEKAHDDRPVRSIGFSPRGDLIASVGFDGALRLWDPNGKAAAERIEAHRGPAHSVSFSPDGKHLVTAGHDGRVRGWSRDGGPAFDLPAGRSSPVSTVAFAAKAPFFVVADEKGGVNKFDFGGALKARLKHSGEGPIRALAIAPVYGTIAGSGRDGKVWRWRRGGRIQPPALHARGRVSALAWSPEGRMLAVGTRPFQLWGPNGKEWQYQLRSVDEVVSIAFPPFGRIIVTGSLLGDLQVWSRDGRALAHRSKKGIEVVGSLAVAPDGGSFIAAIGKRQTVVQEFSLDLAPRGEPFVGHRGAINGMVFSPDGRFVMGGEDGVVRLWTLPSREVETIDVGLPIDQLGFWRSLLWVRANGQWLFLYETNGTLVASLLLDRNAALAFTPDGWYSATSPSTRVVNVYDESGALLSPSAASSRQSAERVLAAVVGQAD